MGRSYYLTTLDAWRRSASRFASSHYAHADVNPDASALPSAAMILAFVEADEGVHNALAADPEWKALPHPLANKPVSPRVAGALAAHGIAPGATTFESPKPSRARIRSCATASSESSVMSRK